MATLKLKRPPKPRAKTTRTVKTEMEEAETHLEMIERLYGKLPTSKRATTPRSKTQRTTTTQKTERQTTMAVYSTTISSSPANAAGQVTTTISSDQFNGENFISSEDFNNTGPSVIDGQTGVRKAVFSQEDLNPSDLVEVSGIQMTVAQAKAAGINITVNPTAETSRDVTAKAPGDNSDDEAPVDIDTRRDDDGHATDGEIIALDTVASAVELHTGLDRESTLELGEDILLGQVPQGDAVWEGLQRKGISQDAARASVNNVVQVGQSAAMQELGHADYRELSQLADNSPAIKAVVIKHGVKRMSGKANMSWKEVLTLARRFAKS